MNSNVNNNDDDDNNNKNDNTNTNDNNNDNDTATTNDTTATTTTTSTTTTTTTTTTNINDNDMRSPYLTLFFICVGSRINHLNQRKKTSHTKRLLSLIENVLRDLKSQIGHGSWSESTRNC